MPTNLQGIQIYLPAELVKELRTLDNTLNLERGVIVQVVLENHLDSIVVDNAERVLAVNQERQLARMVEMREAKKVVDKKTEPKTTPKDKSKSVDNQPK